MSDKAKVVKWKQVGVNKKTRKPIYEPALVETFEDHKVQQGEHVKKIRLRCVRKWDKKSAYTPDQPEPVAETAKGAASA